MTDITPKGVIERYRHAKEQRGVWESHWQECYDYALPQPDAVDQLAASLLAQLTLPWARWFGFTPGPDATKEERETMADALEHTAATMKSHFDRSNFAVEMHQCYLDLVTAGTASLLFEEAPPGEPSAFRFTAVPLSQVVFEESAFGRLDTIYRRSELTPAQLKSRFPHANLPDDARRQGDKDPDTRIAVIEAVIPNEPGFAYMAVAETDPVSLGEPTVLSEGRFTQSPFINFRWLKAPGEIYGRSPVMKTLPDIKTANKVVELVLKNATIAVTGIWQADDDGVLNPANIKLTPGTVIPKAVGSAGLTPLEAPGRFDVSEIVLGDLRDRIRQALLADKLSQVNTPKMTATEVLERAADMTRILGATYGRLQSELLTPLVGRALSVLARRGEIDDLPIDGRIIDLEYKSPLARQQTHQDSQNILQWLESVQTLGPEGLAAVNQAATARWLGRTYGVPAELIRELPDPADGLLTSGPLDGEALAAGVQDLIDGLGDTIEQEAPDDEA